MCIYYFILTLKNKKITKKIKFEKENQRKMRKREEEMEKEELNFWC